MATLNKEKNVNLTAFKIANAQRHNEREKESYTNPDIVSERLSYNVHFKTPTGSYAEMFEQMKSTVYKGLHRVGI